MSAAAPPVASAPGAASLSQQRPAPSHATLPSARSKRGRRSTTSTPNDAAPPSGVHSLAQVKQKQRRKQRHQRASSGSGSTAPGASPLATAEGLPSPAEASFTSAGMAVLHNLFTSWSRSNESTSTPISTAPPSFSYYGGRTAAAAEDEHTSSFDSGNETDHEDAARAPERPHSRAHSVAASYASEDEDAGTRSQLVPCDYHVYGCESLVQWPGTKGGLVDGHYASAFAHHLSLVQAKCAIVSSQKAQIALQLEQEAQARDHAQRKAEKMERRYAKLRAAYERKREALQHAKRMQGLQDIVGQFLAGDEQVDAALQIRQLKEQLATTRAELQEKDRLLVEAAEFIKAEAGKQQQQQPSTQSPPVPTVPFVATTYKQPKQPRFSPQTAMQQAHMQAQVAAAVAQAQSHMAPAAPPQREVVYYGVPHSALKPLRQFLNSANVSSFFNSAASHTTRPPSARHPAAAEDLSGEPGGQLSRGAKLGLDNFCPNSWLKRVGDSEEK